MYLYRHWVWRLSCVTNWLSRETTWSYIVSGSRWTQSPEGLPTSAHCPLRMEGQPHVQVKINNSNFLLWCQSIRHVPSPPPWSMSGLVLCRLLEEREDCSAARPRCPPKHKVSVCKQDMKSFQSSKRKTHCRQNMMNVFTTVFAPQIPSKGQPDLSLEKTPASRRPWATGRRTGGRRAWIRKEMQPSARPKVNLPDTATILYWGITDMK